MQLTVLTLFSFIMQVLGEVEVAALIEGASQLAVMLRIVFSLIWPALVTMLVINFIIGWNELSCGWFCLAG